jgi:hypothetical protein
MNEDIQNQGLSKAYEAYNNTSKSSHGKSNVMNHVMSH